MKNGFLHKKIIAFLMSLILMFNLILIPKINAQAASFPSTTSFTYTYDGYNYQFYFSGLVDSPQDYRFDSSALDYLLQKSAEGINISVSSGIGAKISNIFSSGFTAIFNLYRNFVIATDKLVADWIVFDDIYGFEFQFTGIDSSYPGYETYGDAYGWRFIGWLGEKIDLVLDSQGMLYGSNPIGNYTFSDDQLDLGRWSIHQYEAQGGEFWAPSVNTTSFSDLKEPYIIGKTLYFYVYDGQTEYEAIVPDFTNTVLSFSLANGYLYGIRGFKTTDQPVSLIINNTTINSYYASTPVIYDGIHANGTIRVYNQFAYASTPFAGQLSINYPAFYGYQYNSQGYYVHANNGIGALNASLVSGNGDIWLEGLSTTPLPDPIVLPVDVPIPVSDIEPDPIDFEPDPDTDPDPIPGIDYPVPGPTPVPVPPLPPLVSGNDDLWPDMNEVFAIESDMDSYLGGLSNFQFTPLRTLVEGFSSALMWVSTIMMALYNGSDFSVLFVVLSIFFIAAALLGIYKWWTH